ncbi:signal peptidase I [Methanosarcina spelaei]|nr:signal peptidase I [Methanosarcina spelaei]
MKIIKFLIGLIFIVIVVPIVATLVPTGPVKFMTVTGSSMEPTITSSDIIVVDTTKTQPVVGDIVSYHHTFEENQRFIVTHRIVGVEIGGYRTKGDAYTKADGYIVSPENVIGVMCFKIPYLGELVHFAGTSKGLLLLVIFPALTLIVQELREIIRLIER